MNLQAFTAVSVECGAGCYLMHANLAFYTPVTGLNALPILTHGIVTPSQGRFYYCPHPTDKETEAQIAIFAELCGW